MTASNSTAVSVPIASSAGPAAVACDTCAEIGRAGRDRIDYNTHRPHQRATWSDTQQPLKPWTVTCVPDTASQ